MNSNYKYRYVYSPAAARFLIDRGYQCEAVKPNPRKPWLEVFLFLNTPALEQDIIKYTGERKTNGHNQLP